VLLLVGSVLHCISQGELVTMNSRGVLKAVVAVILNGFLFRCVPSGP
jgi:hypothetical protein